MNLRTATADDAPALLARMAEGFEGYRGFAPDRWEPAMPTTEVMRGRITSPRTWTMVAEDGGLAGHVAFVPSDESGHPEPDPALAHLWQLFVRPSDWGTGLATDLLARAVAEAGARGFTEMRLFTPAGQARARRFYEREGWTAVREFDDPRLGLGVVEYRRDI